MNGTPLRFGFLFAFCLPICTHVFTRIYIRNKLILSYLIDFSETFSQNVEGEPNRSGGQNRQAGSILVKLLRFSVLANFAVVDGKLLAQLQVF